jgi:HD superfamily phosphohydrolase
MINTKAEELKVFRDPIHEYIHVEYQVIWDAINSSEFQRLRRIHQMGTSYLVYHSAEHSRFSHCLGVYEITRRLCEEVLDVKESITESEKIQVLLAALLHDLGHGPFSHFFETVTKVSHEALTQDILLKDTEIHHILENAESGLSLKVASILAHTHPKTLLTQLISSQLDADRMDYLLRDATFSGTTYGHFDLGRILRTLRVVDDRLVIKMSGIHSVEDYIMARYHMYWQVYFHPSSRAVEAVLMGFFKRFEDLRKENESIVERYPMFDFIGKPSPIDYFDLLKSDENACFYGFQCCAKDEDKILSDLALRLLNRHLFEDDDKHSLETLRDSLIQQGFDPRYYLYQDKLEKDPYSPYHEDRNLIYILMKDESIQELSKVSDIVSAVVAAKQKEDLRCFYPKELKL